MTTTDTLDAIDRTAGDPVIRPDYYKRGGIEVIDFIDAYDLNFCLATVVKYLARAGKKDPAKTLEDLRKAAFYLSHEIAKREREGGEGR